MADPNELPSQVPTTKEMDYITAVFPNFLQPLADLCDTMLSLPSGEPNEVQTSVIENGYAISIITLSAFLVEGACGRARYFKDLLAVGIPALGRCLGKRWSAVETLRKFDEAPVAEEIEETLREFDETPLAEKIEEIFVVRDAIAHAHLWTSKVAWTENNLKFTGHPVQLPGYGDHKFRRIVDLNSRTTRKLTLDVFPTRIHRGTAIGVLKVCAEALESLEMKHEEFLPLRHRTVRLKDEFVPFYRWVRELHTTRNQSEAGGA
jgi:hypothetical protein